MSKGARSANLTDTARSGVTSKSDIMGYRRLAESKMKAQDAVLLGPIVI